MRPGIFPAFLIMDEKRRQELLRGNYPRTIRKEITKSKRAGWKEGDGWKTGPFRDVTESIPLTWVHKNIVPRNLPLKLKTHPSYIDDLLSNIMRNGVQYPAVILVGVTTGTAYMGDGNHRIVAVTRGNFIHFPIMVWLAKSITIYEDNKMIFPDRSFDVSEDLKIQFSEDLPFMMKPSDVFKSLSK